MEAERTRADLNCFLEDLQRSRRIESKDVPLQGTYGFSARR